MASHSYDDSVVIPELRGRLVGDSAVAEGRRHYFDAPEIDLDVYDVIVLCMSGGKDSIASHLRLLDMGADPRRVEWWHHDVDGSEGSSLMDWSFMRDYNVKLAEAFGVPIYFSWLEGGFEGEMLKQNSISKPHKFETPDGLVTLPRSATRSRPATRRRFPQQSASLQTRWCSSAVKIDVGRRALNNQERFHGKRVLFVTGERRQESANRARYNQFEPHFCDRRDGRLARHVDAYRPVLHLEEEEVWDALRRHGVIAPVPYRLSWNRSSCFSCIYNSPRIWATIREHFEHRIIPIARYEEQFGTTISRDRKGVLERAAGARPFEIEDIEALEQARRREYTLPVLVQEGETWVMPAGAFGREGCGAD